MAADVCIDKMPNSSTSSGVCVSIREFDDTLVNPDPVVTNVDTEQLIEDYLSPQKLKSLTGIQDLDEVVFLEMKVNTVQNSLGNFGSMVQNLKQLKLSNSVISSIRDLGTSLVNLQSLWMAKCGLSDLDGISSLCSIKELYLAYNDICEVSPLTMLDTLEVLDLEGNLLDDIAQVEFLVLCPELKRLTLEGNPVCMKPQVDCTPQVQLDYNYRVEIHKVLPKLTYLDDEPFLFDLVDGQKILKTTPAPQHDVSFNEKLQSDWELVTERIKTFNDEEIVTGEGDSNHARPSTARGNRPMTASRQRMSSGRPRTGRQRPGTSHHRLGVSSDHRSESNSLVLLSTAIGERESSDEDDSSDLTHGSSAVICGNPSRALKSRRKNMRKEIVSHQLSTANEDSDVDKTSRRDLFEELKTWRREYASNLSPAQNNKKSSMSPTPPPFPSTSPSPLRRNVNPVIRKSYPLPTPPDYSDRPRTAPSFRHRSSLSNRNRRRENILENNTSKKDLEMNTSEVRINSAPVDSHPLERSPSKTCDLPCNAESHCNLQIVPDSPVISASKELLEQPEKPRGVRPASSRPLTHKARAKLK
ncbi:leucine-rich repeat-containing protein 56-like isoform X2 [Xenia sp. Carnegie-2017]|uniref:leucine-rich repeat-containing protein 56-like isoform X2 n=1 Tax=Xenia sp. Carnegie-2017 TaxID=2897299 RepID=UPI001F03576A|nr:leucine-rich repeat-containing protein 56-like isoform X2 [Xenia sp. Carnegie-2017]